jgi:L-amino acid N-acyltransferase YncA
VPVEVRATAAGDWPAVERIYADGIATGDATFEMATPSWEAFDAARLPDQRLVAVIDDEVVGWAAASPVSERCVYAGVVEHSVYVAPGHAGRGVGRVLLDALIASTEAAGIWTIQTGIFAENAASLALHERCGFRVVGRRERIGCHEGRWRDVLFLERRSAAVG